MQRHIRGHLGRLRFEASLRQSLQGAPRLFGRREDIHRVHAALKQADEVAAVQPPGGAGGLSGLSSSAAGGDGAAPSTGGGGGKRPSLGKALFKRSVRHIQMMHRLGGKLPTKGVCTELGVRAIAVLVGPSGVGKSALLAELFLEERAKWGLCAFLRGGSEAELLAGIERLGRYYVPEAQELLQVRMLLLLVLLVLLLLLVMVVVVLAVVTLSRLLQLDDTRGAIEATMRHLSTVVGDVGEEARPEEPKEEFLLVIDDLKVPALLRALFRIGKRSLSELQGGDGAVAHQDFGRQRRRGRILIGARTLTGDEWSGWRGEGGVAAVELGCLPTDDCVAMALFWAEKGRGCWSRKVQAQHKRQQRELLQRGAEAEELGSDGWCERLAALIEAELRNLPLSVMIVGKVMGSGLGLGDVYEHFAKRERAVAAELRRRVSSMNNKLKRTLGRFDEDGSGSLSVNELVHACAELRLGLTERDVRSHFEELDFNHDGELSVEEFASLLAETLIERTLHGEGWASIYCRVPLCNGWC